MIENNAGYRYAAPMMLPIAGILLGWAGAALLMPDIDYYKPGALIPSGIAFSLGLVSGPLATLLLQRSTVFRLEYILLFGVFYWAVLDAAQGAYGFAGVSREALMATFTALAVFSVAIIVGSALMSFVRVRLPALISDEMDTRYLYWAILGCFFLGMLRVFLACRFDPICVASGLLVSRFESPWAQADIGQFDTILHQMRYFGYLVLPLTAALLHVQRRFDSRVIVGVVLGLIILLVVIQGGGRRQVGLILGATGLIWLLLNRPVRLRHLAFMLIFGLATLFLLEKMLVWRNQGIGQHSESHVADVSYLTREPLIKVDQNLLFMAHIVERVPRLYPHTGSTGVLFTLTAPIPRSVYPSKPAHRGFPLTHILQLRRGPGWTWTCSAVCDLYLIGGFSVVVLGGFFFGALANLGNRLLYLPITTSRVLLFGVLGMTLFVGLRAIHELTVTGFAIFAVLALLYAQRFMDARRRADHAEPS